MTLAKTELALAVWASVNVPSRERLSLGRAFKRAVLVGTRMVQPSDTLFRLATIPVWI
jgi:hypothetical protein